MKVLAFFVIGGLIASLAFGFWKLTRYFWLKIFYRFRGVQDVDVLTAQRWRGRSAAILLDVREPDEYVEAHVDGVTLIPLGQLASRTNELAAYKRSPLLVICRGGVRSAKACLILEKQGFEHPLNVAGGMNAWKRQKLPFVVMTGAHTA